ncbi:MAG: DUF2088 domain-containing protein [Chloroflexota bacterium]|nr:MAG: DUF2088 domain-containing protein [Chloroflexota bacterium]
MFPRMVAARQRFDADEIEDLPGAISVGLRRLDLRSRVRPNGSVAVAVGSRGVSPLLQVVATVVAQLREVGLCPFIVPAMGSHGGGTAEGQRAVLRGYGISEEDLGAEVRSAMETALVGHTPDGVPVHFDVNALAADAVLVIGRIKPHTGFHGPIESGLCKMLAVGLGKADGARVMHAAGLATAIPAAACVILSRLNLTFGVALVENAYDRPCRVEVVDGSAFHATDEALLIAARAVFPRLPLAEADVLIIEEMGKNISGTGMDPNVIGMWRRFGGERVPNYRNIAVLGLSEASHGNANGIGFADFTTRRLVDAVDWPETYLNALTALSPAIARIPITLATDRECIAGAIDLARRTNSDPTVIRIRNTLEIADFWVSRNLATAVGQLPMIDLGENDDALAFDTSGRLTPADPYR